MRKIKPALNFYRSIDIHSYDVIYTNTLAILDGALIKLFFKKRHVWHVHEIIESPALIRLTFKLLLSLFSDSIIFNSSASSRCFSPFRVLFFPLPKTQIVLNGCPPVIFNQDYSSSIRIDYGVENRMTFSLVGRINHWKGHELLVEAVSLLPSDVLNSTQFLIIGDTVPGDESRLSSLHQKIETLSLSEKFTFTGFIFDKKVAWALTDVAISASTLPEPFGMVIIEAFSAGIPVISASHGGPLEIIDDNKNGIFFTPGCAQSLANAITSTFRNKSATKDMAKLARVAHIENFTDIQYTKKIKEAIDE
ncbi:Mannosylfructose-phosphate synthase [compost metagenome]